MSTFFFLAVSGLLADWSLFFLFFSFLAASSGSSLTAPSSVYLKKTLCFLEADKQFKYPHLLQQESN